LKLRLINALAVAALVVLGASAVRADDGHVGIGGSPTALDPGCGSSQGTTSVGGTIDDSCLVTSGLVTSITFAVLDSDTNGGLTVTSDNTDPTGFVGLTDLSNEIFPNNPQLAKFFSFLDWTTSGDCGGASGGSSDPTGTDTCTLNAPTFQSLPAGIQDSLPQIEAALAAWGIVPDGKCDAQDFIFGIPQGCYIVYDTPDSNSLFVGNVPYDVGTNGMPLISLPEPSTLALLLMGLGAIPFVRRRRLAN